MISIIKTQEAYNDMIHEAKDVKSLKAELSDMPIESQKSVLWHLIGYFGKDTKFFKGLESGIKTFK